VAGERRYCANTHVTTVSRLSSVLINARATRWRGERKNTHFHSHL